MTKDIQINIERTGVDRPFVVRFPPSGLGDKADISRAYATYWGDNEVITIVPTTPFRDKYGNKPTRAYACIIRGIVASAITASIYE